MLLADVNVFLYARRRESERHEEYRGWLEERLSGVEPFGVSELVLASFVRIVTNRRVYVEPTPLAAALEYCETVLQAPATLRVRPGTQHWSIFTDLCRQGQARRHLVPDAYLAALAVEQGATWVTTDRGFSRFPGLRVGHPLDD